MAVRLISLSDVRFRFAELHKVVIFTASPFSFKKRIRVPLRLFISSKHEFHQNHLALNEEKGMGKGGRGGVHYGMMSTGLEERGYP